MNYQKIMNLCKKRKFMTLYTDGGRQWVSDGNALYPLLGMPLLDAQSIRAIYDMPEGMQILETQEMPEGIYLGDVDWCENQIFREKIQLQPNGLDVIGYRTQAGVTFAEEKYLSPITGIGTDGNVCVYERVSKETGKIYIVVKRGMLLEAVIQPVQILTKDWVEDLAEITAAIRVTYNREAGVG